MRKFFPAPWFAAVLSLVIIGFGCTKIDTTSLGNDLVTVDNIHTFADTLSVVTSEGIYSDTETVAKTQNYAVGNITTDPLFGKTTAAVYVQFKPGFFPYYFGTAGDTTKNDPHGHAGLDSAFICLSFAGVYGDSLPSSVIPQTFEVRRITDPVFRTNHDSLFRFNYQPSVDPTLLGSAVITPQSAAGQTVLGYGKDSVSGQIRIKLNTAAGMALAQDIYYNQDSSASSANNALNNDSLFSNRYNGFAITVTGPGNTLYYVNLSDAKTRMEFHFHQTLNGVIDTTLSYLPFYAAPATNIYASSSADFISRDYTGTTVPSPGTNDVFVQTSSGTSAQLHIPALTNYSNRIIHRAYLVAEQTPNDVTTDTWFQPPPYLYLDLKDTVLPVRYKPVYFDLNSSFFYNPDATNLSSLYHPFPAANVDITNFGGNALTRYDAFGNPYARYEINITRYVQHIVTNGYHNYDLRLFAPYDYSYPQFTGNVYTIPFYNPLAFGRVRLGSGANPVHPMRLIVVYSKI